eukprot:TRINITY_DN66349_c5_g12_i1.p1 TRINITY_DN66349_c5_g12~~TRINITY_DN66349_c5_g12_i1.p1  ORF type:complete len:1279 (+),score=714.79 TRINITY_DN66349_c5_g12_i1:34-3837(+)
MKKDRKKKKKKTKQERAAGQADGYDAQVAAVTDPKGAVAPHRAHLVRHHEQDGEGLKTLVRPHVESFNFMMDEGLALAADAIHPMMVDGDANTGRPHVRMWFEDVSVGFPQQPGDLGPLYPNECRERGLTYQAPISATVVRQLLDPNVSPSRNAPPAQLMPLARIKVNLGMMPIMVKSSRCHLRNMSRRQLVEHKEEANEMGGYFVLNGIERICRILIMQRRNHVLAIVRPSFTNRGTNYTAYATTIRCVRPDQSSQTVNLHYLENGTCRFRFTHRKQEFFIPVVLLLRAFTPTTDLEIFDEITAGDRSDTFASDRAEIMLREINALGIITQEDALKYLGESFRIMMRLPESTPSVEIGRRLLDDLVFVHISGRSAHIDGRHKFNLLIHMVRKLFALVSGRIQPDNPDALSMHELLLPGHLYNAIFKEKLADWLISLRATVIRDLRTRPAKVKLADDVYWRKAMTMQADVGRKMAHFLVTGNLVSRTGLDLMQTSGFTIVADKLNFLRFLSHFRSVHRGQFFMEMKTTAVRKLLPESWGFMCPVHTPDGSPCGLLNHLSATCIIQTHPFEFSARALINLMAGMGMNVVTDGSSSALLATPKHLVVMLDGIVVGRVAPAVVKRFVRQLRHLKVVGHEAVPKVLEIAYLPDRGDLVFPGVYLSTTPARMLRPVRHLGVTALLKKSGKRSPAPASLFACKKDLSTFKEDDDDSLGRNGRKNRRQGDSSDDGDSDDVDDGLGGKLKDHADVELIGSLEQVYLNVACTMADYRQGETTHMELSPNNMLSVIAGFTPFSDHNQSPRNMYQCQMGKQTMGTPFHSLPHRTDNKTYRLQTPQVPIVRNDTHADYMVDEYPLGTNAVVAVISYTGYDMEDAMIVNKSSYERGFAHASVYKSKFVDAVDRKRRSAPKASHRFGNERRKVDEETGEEYDVKAEESLDERGLPEVGTWLKHGDPLYAIVDNADERTKVSKHKESEPCAVEEVRVIDHDGGADVTSIGLKLRLNRNPVIGDKFSSRHGQKGVLSRLWPQTDMPFSESGMSPDIIINPHAFPSRMTIGMLVESMAGKSGAMHGLFQDGSPFRFSEQNRAVDYFGEQLVKAGYNYAGNEVMYSGITGEEFKVDIFLGIVYYQRLRHMVSDKSQVRALGPINQLTRQPIKGRKVHGGIRFGEMERDSLLAHGASYLLQDRLLYCSDYSTTIACTQCGSLLAPIMSGRVGGPNAKLVNRRGTWKCRNCDDENQNCVTVAVPYVFTYLANELAAMNIRLTLDVVN